MSLTVQRLMTFCYVAVITRIFSVRNSLFTLCSGGCHCRVPYGAKLLLFYMTYMQTTPYARKTFFLQFFMQICITYISASGYPCDVWSYLSVFKISKIRIFQRKNSRVQSLDFLILQRHLPFVQITPSSLGMSYQFDWHAINDLQVNQNDMTRPNSVVLFAQTRVFRYVTVLYHPIPHIDYLTLFLASIYKIK